VSKIVPIVKSCRNGRKWSWKEIRGPGSGWCPLEGGEQEGGRSKGDVPGEQEGRARPGWWRGTGKWAEQGRRSGGTGRKGQARKVEGNRKVGGARETFRGNGEESSVNKIRPGPWYSAGSGPGLVLTCYKHSGLLSLSGLLAHTQDIAIEHIEVFIAYKL